MVVARSSGNRQIALTGTVFFHSTQTPQGGIKMSWSHRKCNSTVEARQQGRSTRSKSTRETRSQTGAKAQVALPSANSTPSQPTEVGGTGWTIHTNQANKTIEITTKLIHAQVTGAFYPLHGIHIHTADVDRNARQRRCSQHTDSERQRDDRHSRGTCHAHGRNPAHRGSQRRHIRHLGANSEPPASRTRRRRRLVLLLVSALLRARLRFLTDSGPPRLRGRAASAPCRLQPESPREPTSRKATLDG